MSNKLPVLGGILFALLGSIAIFVSILRFLKAKKSKLWPVCNGSLLEAQLVDFGAQGRNYSVVAKYKYFVNQREYINNKICFYTLVRKDECLEILGAIKRNNFVDVYWNPINPQESVLVPGFGYKPYSDLFISIVVTFVGVMIVIFV